MERATDYKVISVSRSEPNIIIPYLFVFVKGVLKFDCRFFDKFKKKC